jgi:hypothetical protein
VDVVTADRAAARRVAWVAFALGSVASVAANVAHTLTPPPYVVAAWAASGRQPADLVWTAPAGAVLAAAWSPVALLVTVELLCRVPWPASVWRALPRYAAALTVATVAAVVSYRHMRGLLAAYGEDGLTAAIEPLSVDGLMVVSALALLALSRSAALATDRADAGTATGQRTEDGPRTAVRSRPVVPAPTAVPVPAPAGPRTPNRPRTQRSGTRRSREPRTDGDLARLGREVAAELAAAGRPLTRAVLLDALRSRGQRISTGRATDLLRQLRDDPPAAIAPPSTEEAA